MSSPYLSAILSLPGLVAHWTCGDAPGSSTLADSGPNALSALLHGSASNAALGRPSLLASEVGTSLLLDNTAFGYAQVLDTGALDFTTSEMMILAWVNFAAAQPGALGYVVAKVPQWSLGVTTSVVGSRGSFQGQSVVTAGGLTSTDTTPFTSLMAGQTYLLALYYDGTFLVTYTNGQQDFGGLRTGAIATGARNLGIGGKGDGNNGLAGTFQHVTILSKHLTTAQIRNLYVIGTTPAGAQPVAGAQAALVYPWSVGVLPANASRKRLTVTNDDDAVVWLSLGATATVNKGIQLPPYGGRHIVSNYTGPVSAIHNWPMGYKSLCLLEET